MNIKQFYICAAIFLALTVLRFTSPALAERVSDGISKAINMEQEQTEAVIELGKSLADGDIINVDCSTILDGYFSDSSRMFCIGDVDPEMRKLVDVARECVELGLEQVKPWGHLGDVGQAINDHARANGYSVVREVGGHGIGLEFHETPFVSYVTKKGTDMVMAPGMVFTIEPMVNMGDPDIFIDEDNGWTIYTDDDMPSAQWEIMVRVTEDGHEVMCW